MILLQNYWKCDLFKVGITRITRIELPAGKLPADNYPPRAGLRVVDHPISYLKIEVAEKAMPKSVLSHTVLARK